MATDEEHVADPDEKTPPGNDKGVKPPKVLTEDEFNRRMAGLAKAKEKSDAEVARLRKREEDAAREKLEQEGQWKQLAEDEKQKRLQHEARLSEYEAKEASRAERLSEKNAARVKALASKEARDAAKRWQEKLSADDFSDWLDDAEVLVPGQKTRDVDGGGGRSAPEDAEAAKKAAREATRKRGLAFILGGDK